MPRGFLHLEGKATVKLGSFGRQTLNAKRQTSIVSLDFRAMAEKRCNLIRNFVDHGRVEWVKVGLCGVKWFIGPQCTYGVRECTNDLCRRIPACDGREKSRHDSIALAPRRHRRVLCNPKS